MQKDFQTWTNIKEESHLREFRALFKEREVWWCKLGVNVGDEEDGKGDLFLRPVLVIKKFNKRVFVGLPFSSIIKEDHYFYHKFEFKGKEQSVIISQIKLFDAKRFHYKMGRIDEDDFKEIKEKAKNLIF